MTIPDMAGILGVSVGTVTKAVAALCDDGLVHDGGTVDTSSGRKPHLYCLDGSAGCFLGVDTIEHDLSVGLMDLSGGIIDRRTNIKFDLDNSPASLERYCAIVKDLYSGWNTADRRIIAACINISGRVNSITGRSYTFLSVAREPLGVMLENIIGVPFFLCNDTRSRAYAEYMLGEGGKVDNMVFINLNWGLGLGIIIGGRLYGGKSGYAGEFGHFHGYDNNILCRCGKKGCLETEISGQAFCREVVGRIAAGETSILGKRVLEEERPLTLHEAMDALSREDILCIEVMEKIGHKLGVQVAGLINLFNPEQVVIGGDMAAAGEYLLQPLRAAVDKYSLRMVSNDTEIRMSSLGRDSGIMGACMVARSRYFGDAM